MREIKFRGKRTDNIRWIYGDLHHGFMTHDSYINGHSIMAETVGQYTGLTDKNGTEIYEGDITNHHSHKTTVSWQWSENYNQICGVEADGTHRFYFSIDSVNLEIIGNIYDNPKLLEEGN